MLAANAWAQPVGACGTSRLFLKQAGIGKDIQIPARGRLYHAELQGFLLAAVW